MIIRIVLAEDLAGRDLSIRAFWWSLIFLFKPQPRNLSKAAILAPKHPLYLYQKLTNILPDLHNYLFDSIFRVLRDLNHRNATRYRLLLGRSPETRILKTTLPCLHLHIASTNFCNFLWPNRTGPWKGVFDYVLLSRGCNQTTTPTEQHNIRGKESKGGS